MEASEEVGQGGRGCSQVMGTVAGWHLLGTRLCTGCFTFQGHLWLVRDKL